MADSKEYGIRQFLFLPKLCKQFFHLFTIHNIKWVPFPREQILILLLHKPLIQKKNCPFVVYCTNHSSTRLKHFIYCRIQIGIRKPIPFFLLVIILEQLPFMANHWNPGSYYDRANRHSSFKSIPSLKMPPITQHPITLLSVSSENASKNSSLSRSRISGICTRIF